MEETSGLIIVNTGNGKGKTTAALGMGLRAWGQGLKVLILQFIKGDWKYGELKAIEQLGPNFVIYQLGEGFVRNSTKDEKIFHQQAAEYALKLARQEMLSNRWEMMILDEINYAIHFGLISVRNVMDFLEMKPPNLHVVLTGRYVAQEIINKADLVTEMREIKHPFKNGIKAQKGVEF